MPLSHKDTEMAVDILQKHLTSSEMNVHTHNQQVNVQFHDLYDCIGDILHELTEDNFRFTVQSVFEAPPKLIITKRYGE